MANTNSTLITNSEASPPVANDVGWDGGRVRTKMGSVAVAAADIDADGDTIKLCRVPSNGRIVSIEVGHDDLDSGATAAYNVGLYTAAGALVDEDAYASAVTCQAAAALTRLENEARNISATGQKVWQDAGASADTGLQYDIVLTMTAANAGAQAGDIAFVVKYAVD